MYHKECLLVNHMNVDGRYVTLGGVYRPALRSVTRPRARARPRQGGGGVKFSGNKRYVTL